MRINVDSSVCLSDWAGTDSRCRLYTLPVPQVWSLPNRSIIKACLNNTPVPADSCDGSLLCALFSLHNPEQLCWTTRGKRRGCMDKYVHKMHSVVCPFIHSFTCPQVAIRRYKNVYKPHTDLQSAMALNYAPSFMSIALCFVTVIFIVVIQDVNGPLTSLFVTYST